MPKMNSDLTVKVHRMSGDQLLKELQRTSKILNLRLRALEKKDLQTSSKFYIDASAARQRGVWYMSYTKHGEMKYTTNFKSLSTAQRRDLLRRYYNFMDYESSTIKGTREIEKKRTEGVKNAVLSRVTERGMSQATYDKIASLPSNKFNEVAKMLRERGLLSQYTSDMSEVIGDLIDKSDQQIMNILDKFIEFKANAPYGEIAHDDAIEFFKTSAAAFDAL